MSTTTFLNLSPKQSKDLDRHIFNNARQLKRDAILIAETNKSFSSSSSILVLSTEETIKAILVFLHSQNYKVYNFKGSKKLFTQHTIRHDIAKFLELISRIFKMFEKYEEVNKSLIKTNVKWFNELVNGAYTFLNTIIPLLEAGSKYFEIEKFDNYKKKGFYVDYENNVLVPKVEINATEYKVILNVLDSISVNYKILRILFHPKINNHICSEKLEEFKKSLNEIVELVLDLSVRKR